MEARILTATQRAFVERRLADAEHDEGEPWETFREELLADLEEDETPPHGG